MSRLFTNRITDSGREAIQDLIDQVAKDLNRTVKIHGEDSLEAARERLILASMHYTMEEYEDALPLLRSYLTICRARLDAASDEVFHGLSLLSNTLMGAGRLEEAFSVIEEIAGMVNQFGYQQGRAPLLDGLKELAEKYQSGDDPKSVQRTFVLALMILSWCVTVYGSRSPVYCEYLPIMRSVFENYGFNEDLWGWLVKRAHQTDNDFVGLVSVLMGDGMFPSEPTAKHPSETVGEGDLLLKGYEISGFKREHWTSDDGFSKAFPITVAEGELSLRVERLLAEGCTYLGTTGALGTAFLIFSPHLVGRRITAFGTTTWSKEEEALSTKQVRETIAEHGADSAMMLGWVDLPHSEAAESDEVRTEAVMVVARDAKSYFRGLQPARKVDGKYIFDEPMVTVTEDDWFSEFTFPVQPAGKET